MPVELLTPVDREQISGILAFRHAKVEQIRLFLHDRNIHVMSHAGRLRIAIHGYNTSADVERFLKQLRAALAAV